MKNIFNHIKTIILTTLMCWASYEIQAQKSTEIYIPLGKSPGVSAKYCVMGRVDVVNAANTTITVKQGTAGKTFNITKATVIYLDKSKLKLRNTKGSFSDIKPGALVEVKYKDNKPDGLIEWIKVQLE